MVALFAVIAASWAVLMGVAPLLQVRRMLERRSSEDVSIGYLLVLLPGFALWILYGIASSDLALVIPNTVALAVATGTTVCAILLRRSRGVIGTRLVTGTGTVPGMRGVSEVSVAAF